MVRYMGQGGSLQGGKSVILDLRHGIASIIVTKYVPKYSTKVVTRYMTKYQRVITALTINYLLNGQVITQVVIPTRIVLPESASKGGQPNVAVGARRRRIRTIPKNIRQLQQLMV